MLAHTDRRQLVKWLLTHALVGAATLAVVSHWAVTLARTDRYTRSMAMRNIRVFKRGLNHGADVALIGNSYLARAVRHEPLNKALAADDHRATLLAQPGAVSPFWYLAIKHYVGGAAPRVKLVLVFIMDYELTDMPRRMLSDNVMALLTDVRTPDPEFRRMVLQRSRGNGDLTDLFLLGLRLYWPGYGYRNSLRDPVFDTLTGWPAAQLRRLEPCKHWPPYSKAVRQVIRRQMTVRAPVADKAERITADDFARRMERSFFPAMERVCREQGVTLGVVRLKRHPRFAREQPLREQSLNEYMAHLAAYCGARDIPFLDFSRDPRLDETCFSKDNHMEAPGRDYLTLVMARRILDALRRLPETAGIDDAAGSAGSQPGVPAQSL
jgi:hypothetical protein